LRNDIPESRKGADSVTMIASIIMPVLNEAQLLSVSALTLRRLQRKAELLIVDGGSSDDSVILAESITSSVLQTAAGRALQMNAGAAAAHADYLVFLHADTQLPDDFPDFLAALSHSRPEWGFFTVKLEPGNKSLSVVGRFMNWRSRLTAVATGDQAIFVKRTNFTSMGGFAAIPLMEDVELCKRLRRLARPFIWSSPVHTSSRRWRQRGVLPTVCLMWGLRLQYVLGVSPQRLYQKYYGK
jgi:rSAM/selenodomain-associated transferase 2